MIQQCFEFCSHEKSAEKGKSTPAKRPPKRSTRKPPANTTAANHCPADGKKIKELQASVKSLQADKQALVRSLEASRTRVKYFESEVASLQRQNALLWAKKEVTGKYFIPPDMLNRLIRLSHPDRHGNSPASNEATAWLLAQRQKK